MSTNEKINRVKALLGIEGIYEGEHYILSLQGPTVISMMAGDKKFKSLDGKCKDRVESMGVKFMLG